MAIGFDDFDDIGVIQETDRIAMRPIDEAMAIIKHDARDGSLKVVLSNGNDEEPDEVNASQIEFAPVLVYGFIKGSDDDKNLYSSALSLNRFYDVYCYKENGGSESLGILKSDEAYHKSNGNTGFYSRIFGVLRSVDGKNPLNISEIKEHFTDTKIVPCFIDMKTVKTTKLRGIVGRNWSKGIKHKFVTIIGGKKGLSYVNGHGNKSYYPDFKVTEDNDALNKMANISQEFLQACFDFNKQIVDHDEFIQELYLHQFTQPNVVNHLLDLGISNVDTLNDYFKTQHTDWRGLRQALNNVDSQKEKDVESATQKVNDFNVSKSDQQKELMGAVNEGMSDDTNDQSSGFDISDDDLPF